MVVTQGNHIHTPATKLFAKTGILFFILSFSEAHAFNYLHQTPRKISQSISSGSPTSRGLVYGGREILNATKNTILEWQVDPLRNPNSTIIFKFSTSITSYKQNDTILLGLSKTGKVAGADIVAVIPSATRLPQLRDLYGVNNTLVVLDSVQNWKLVLFDQNSSHVYFTVSRILNTGDKQDVAINNDLLRIIWGYTRVTKNRNELLSFTPEGSVRQYLLDPIVASTATSTRVKSWRLSRKFHVPPKPTTYWCTIHRGPTLSKKHHVVAYTPYLKDELSRQHVHHTIIHYCVTPIGIDPASVFEKHIDHPGEACYLENRHELPTESCTEVLVGWAIGGKSFSLPDDVGMVLGDTRNEYFMFETHYDNPEVRSDLFLESGVDIVYTPDLRPNDGSLMFIGTGLFGLYLVPPHTQNFKMAGQCSKACTRQMIPPTGVQIVAALLHSHSASKMSFWYHYSPNSIASIWELKVHFVPKINTHAQKVIIRHFRGNRELPSIQSDYNYDFTYQVTRLLRKPITVLAGDHLAVECHMDTLSRNVTTLAGFGTRDEMCLSFITLNKRLPYTYCTSEYPTEVTMAKYGITNMTWTRENKERMVNSARNPKFVGLPVSKVIDEIEGKWTPKRTRELETEQMYGNHETACPQTTLMAGVSYLLQSVDDLTGGFVSGRVFIDRNRPSIRSTSTKLDFFQKVINLIRHFDQ